MRTSCPLFLSADLEFRSRSTFVYRLVILFLDEKRS